MTLCISNFNSSTWLGPLHFHDRCSPRPFYPLRPYLLRQPPFSPRAWLFAPIWTVLYGTMGYAAHHATVTASSAVTSTAAQSLGTTWETLYTSQLVLNYLWMPLFFEFRRPAWALADIVLLGANVAALMHTWWKTDRTAFWLLVPYASWLAFATYLNAGFGMLNKWTIGKKSEKEQ